jgi:hypothetical protein
MVFLLDMCTLATSAIVFGVIGDLFHEAIIVNMVCTKWKCVNWSFHMHLCPSQIIMMSLYNYYWSMCKVSLPYKKLLWCEKPVSYLSFTIVVVKNGGPWTSCNTSIVTCNKWIFFHQIRIWLPYNVYMNNFANKIATILATSYIMPHGTHLIYATWHLYNLCGI